MESLKTFICVGCHRGKRPGKGISTFQTYQVDSIIFQMSDNWSYDN